MLDVAGEEEAERKGEGVDEVVGGGAGADVEEVAEHEEVGREEEDGEEEPAVVQVLVGEDGEDEEDGFFYAEQGGGAGEHGSFIRVFGGDRSLSRRREAVSSLRRGVANKTGGCVFQRTLV